jgi:hypothetical protein
MRFKAGDLVKKIAYDYAGVGLVLSHSKGYNKVMWLSGGRIVTIDSRHLKHSTMIKKEQT